MYKDFYEDGHSKAAKKRIKARQDHIRNRMLQNLNYKHQYSDDEGKHGTVRMGNGPEVPFTLVNGGIVGNYGGAGCGFDFKDDNTASPAIHIPRKISKIKGSDLMGSHEYNHSIDADDYIKQNGYDKTPPDDFIKFGVDFLYDKTSKGNKKMINRNNKKYNIKLNDHDVLNSEIQSDAFALTHTKGNNNANRMRKALNESQRRTLPAKQKITERDIENADFKTWNEAMVKFGADKNITDEKRKEIKRNMDNYKNTLIQTNKSDTYKNNYKLHNAARVDNAKEYARKHQSTLKSRI